MRALVPAMGGSRRGIRIGALIAWCLMICTGAALLASTGGDVRVVGLRGAVNPVTASFLKRNLDDAARKGDRLVLVEMDTPGGLDTAMREIVKDILASPVPVAVYVAPA
ncbi:MAG TPA: serine protease, partial [Geobacter sulfurreducens]|nr:serine protease [Geobacter sulfurreducens]